MCLYICLLKVVILRKKKYKYILMDSMILLSRRDRSPEFTKLPPIYELQFNCSSSSTTA